MDILERSLKKAFIDRQVESSKYDPRIIINNPSKKEFLLDILQDEIDNCQNFFFSVAFITQDGLDVIKSRLADLNKKGIKGKLLTSTYLYFNQPYMFEDLLKIPNLEVRVSEKIGFHAKGYLFQRENFHSFIIGSSNLTVNALKVNYEWNVRLTSYEHGEIIHQIYEHLVSEWEMATSLTSFWIQEYKKIYEIKKSVVPLVEQSNEDFSEKYHVTPNRMQKAALESLRELRESGADKGLVISATGTGKTYLAAFDVAQMQPKRMLFIVHREQILKKAMESFKEVVGGLEEDFGILSGTQKDIQARYLFATIQTISKKEYRELFSPNDFDYLLIDEVHKAGAQSYLNVIDYFEPNFLLGMTATPERTDGFNIFELFDFNIAYEIRLQEALEEDFLCPFHYFGVTDYEKDGLLIDETSDLKYLTNQERVDFLIEKINYYSCSRNNPKGLVFCSRKSEAKKMAELFRHRGIPSSYLSGENSTRDREAEIQKLETGEINYIFTVDIFNEGIDIPKINQVIMLRNTQSSIIFLQQLGRGLRKDPSKDFVTVIDFIGNYKNNYMIPMAFSGDNTRNKNNLRRDTFDTNYISGLSSINFEQVAKERIFKSIDEASLDSMVEIKKGYEDLKNRLNRVPYLLDFQKFGSIDPQLIANKEKTYYNFLTKIGEAEGILSEQENLALLFITRELLSGIRPHELLIIAEFINSSRESMTITEIRNLLLEKRVPCSEETLDSMLKVLDLTFYEVNLRRTYQESQLFELTRNTLTITDFFKTARKNMYFSKMFGDLIDTALEKNKEYDLLESLSLYKKYRRKDVLRMLNMEFSQNEQGIGGYTFSNNHFVIFVTLDKGKNFKASQIAYEDEFIDERIFKWFTKSNRTLQSKEVAILKDRDNWDVHLFIKRKYNDRDKETDFYYLGKIKPIIETIKQEKKPINTEKNVNIVDMEFILDQPVEPNLYKFLTSTLMER
ncbi:DEAD/DEAH box helicase [Enterococcus sp. JM9B]|uniref:DEAD/DEAH box helicase n=1 Tax=Enterococcus sp. JM9B TaxID=1857216 RepID=UPI001374EDEE|nr:DEAD/DEAH box helicase [Enterococcus sp. JM9B]KAF1300854.1 NgoFVII family restriction endonuclease [Enterococcus sp. JM9B]